MIKYLFYKVLNKFRKPKSSVKDHTEFYRDYDFCKRVIKSINSISQISSGRNLIKAFESKWYNRDRRYSNFDVKVGLHVEDLYKIIKYEVPDKIRQRYNDVNPTMG